MKVFLSWSGEKSHKVALVFRDWFPSVIQSLEPYVSSEDIDKGTRWSTDIAKELEDSSFGILCVTKDNLTAPWLTFEAGALSKTMDKSFVSPFLFDIKRSEVDGPILQFQSTVFNKDDVFKLVRTLNKACGENQLTDERLDKAFGVWWPTLESELAKLKSVPDDDSSEESLPGDSHSGEILEEILDLTRLNQKLLRNPEQDVSVIIKETHARLEELKHAIESERFSRKRSRRYLHPRVIEELMMAAPKGMRRNYLAFQVGISMFRDEYPWVYEAGLETLRTLKSGQSRDKKDAAVHEFMEFVEFSFEHPIMREVAMPDKEEYMILRELPYLLRHSLEIGD